MAHAIIIGNIESRNTVQWTKKILGDEEERSKKGLKLPKTARTYLHAV